MEDIIVSQTSLPDCYFMEISISPLKNLLHLFSVSIF